MALLSNNLYLLAIPFCLPEIRLGYFLFLVLSTDLASIVSQLAMK